MKYEREYFIHYYDCDNSFHLNIVNLMRYFEDIALLNSEDVGIGLDYYNKNNVAWLLYKWDIIINQLPNYRDTIKIITEPLGFSRFYAYRIFEVRSSNNDLLIQGNSLWFLIDTAIRRPKKISEEFYLGYHVPPEDRRELFIEDVNPPGKIDFQKEFFVRKSDIDINNHVNNTKYVEWALEMVPDLITKNYSLQRLKVNYKKETYYGQNLKVLINIAGDEELKICLHKVVNEADDICFLETHWHKA
jgi:medium-chain acyl-[acyl-carrier-protein] hydrolase